MPQYSLHRDLMKSSTSHHISQHTVSGAVLNPCLFAGKSLVALLEFRPGLYTAILDRMQEWEKAKHLPVLSMYRLGTEGCQHVPCNASNLEQLQGILIFWFMGMMEGGLGVKYLCSHLVFGLFVDFHHGLWECLKYHNLFPHSVAGCRENLNYFCLNWLNYEKPQLYIGIDKLNRNSHWQRLMKMNPSTFKTLKCIWNSLM